jgi:O-antigen ligase
MVTAHPIDGVGTGNFVNSSVHYLLQPGAIQRGDFIISTPKVAHNTFLQLLAEVGIVGTVLFVAIAGISLVSMLRAARRAERSGQRDLEVLARGVFVGTIGFLAAAFFLTSIYSKLMWLLFALGPALLGVARRST